MRCNIVGKLGLLILLWTAGGLAVAQGFPSKSIRMVVGFPPGGLTDNIARILASQLSEVLGQKVYVDNRAGSAGTIATDIVAKAARDGHTLLVADQALIVNPSLYARLPFDTLKDLQPVSLVGAVSTVLVVHPSLPVRSVKALVALAKSHPGEINYGSAGSGSLPHLAGELLKQVAGIDIVHIPYKGVAPATMDLLGGQVSLMFGSIGQVGPHVNAGKLKALAVTGDSPMAVLPGVPTIAEAGYPASSVGGYWGVVVPMGIPRDVLDKLSSSIVVVMKRPEVRQRLIDQGVNPTGSGPAEYDRVIRAEMEKWAKIIKQAGIKAD